MTVQAGPGGNFLHFLLSTGGSSSKVNGFQQSNALKVPYSYTFVFV